LDIVIHRTLVSTSLRHFYTSFAMNKNYKIKDYMLHWCVYFMV